MSCEHLVCARCAGPVVEARCPTCRAARSGMHHPFSLGKPPVVAALLLVLLATVMLLTLQVAH